MRTYEEWLEYHTTKKFMAMCHGNWVTQSEHSRFTPEQRAQADMLFQSIGIDPDVYMQYARAQVVRRKKD